PSLPRDWSRTRKARLQSLNLLHHRVDGDLARDDLLFLSIDLGTHVGRHDLFVVLVLGDAHGAVLEAEQHSLAVFLRARDGVLERQIERLADLLFHRGEDHRSLRWIAVLEDRILVAIDADRELARVLDRLQRADAGAAGDREDDV